MLDFMRKNANSWVMILLFGIIIFVFAINFGPWAGNSMTGVPYAVIVNDEPISMADFRTAYANQFARVKQFRPDYDQAQADKDGLKQMVIEQLISRELLSQLGRKHQLVIGARTLAEEIKERVFGEDEFNKEEYIKRIHNYFQTSVSQFEQQVANEIVAQEMATVLGSAVYVPEDEIKSAYQERNTKIALDFVKVSPAYFKFDKPYGPDEIKRYQEANGQKISNYYHEHLGDYVKEERIRASHILIKVPQGASADEKKVLKEKAQKILERVKNKEDFAEVAKAESDDTGSKVKGGDLDFFSAGMMVEEFSKAAFALKPGEITKELVESPFGFHIIKQTDQKPKVEQKLEEATPAIAEILLRQEEQDEKAKNLASKALEQLKKGVALSSITSDGIIYVKNSQKEPENKAPIASETESFSQSMPFLPNIGRTTSLDNQVFNLTEKNPTLDKVLNVNGAYFAFRLKSRQEADMAKFEEQKNSIKMTLLYPRKRAMIQQLLTQMKESAKIKYNPTLLASSEVIEE